MKSKMSTLFALFLLAVGSFTVGRSYDTVVANLTHKHPTATKVSAATSQDLVEVKSKRQVQTELVHMALGLRCAMPFDRREDLLKLQMAVSKSGLAYDELPMEVQWELKHR